MTWRVCGSGSRFGGFETTIFLELLVEAGQNIPPAVKCCGRLKIRGSMRLCACSAYLGCLFLASELSSSRRTNQTTSIVSPVVCDPAALRLASSLLLRTASSAVIRIHPSSAACQTSASGQRCTTLCTTRLHSQMFFPSLATTFTASRHRLRMLAMPVSEPGNKRSRSLANLLKPLPIWIYLPAL